MKKIFFDAKKGTAKIAVENLDDLWYLSQIVEKGDEITGKTYRKVKLSGSSEKSKVEKKPVTLSIKAEKIEFENECVRINGKVSIPHDDIPKDSYHSISAELGSVIQIRKEKWLKFQQQKLEEAFSRKEKSILIVALDRENALFAVTKQYGYDVILEMEGDVQKKDDRTVSKGHFYEDIIKEINNYTARLKVEHVIVASPSFWKDELLKHLSDKELKKKIVFATCHSADESAIKEVMKRDEIQSVLREQRIAKEMVLVEKLLEEISKEGKAAYGFKEVENASNAGAVSVLLVTDALIKKLRENDDYEKVDCIMKNVDSLNGDIHIISNHEAGKKLDGLGGIGALLRYKINF